MDLDLNLKLILTLTSLSAAFWGFIIMGANDAAIGVSDYYAFVGFYEY
jgi:hypothetical protein